MFPSAGGRMPRSIDILLVEDCVDDVQVAQQTLRQYGMQNDVRVVNDGLQALQYLKREGEFAAAKRPDLVLLDLAMPHVDGLEVLQRMSEDNTLRDIPVVILTSSRMDQEILKKYKLPIDCYVMKPLTLERFLDAVKCFPQFGLSIVSRN